MTRSTESLYQFTKADWDFIHSKERENTITKLELLGDMCKYKTNDNKAVLFDYKPMDEELKLPNIFVIVDKISTNNKLKRIQLGDGVRVLSSYCFYQEGLKKIELNEGLIIVAKQALAGNSFNEIVIPSTVKLLGTGCLSGSFVGDAKIVVHSRHLKLEDIFKACGDNNYGKECTSITIELVPTKETYRRDLRE